MKDWVGRAGIRGRIETRGKTKDKQFLPGHSGLQVSSEIAKGKKKMSLGCDQDSHIVFVEQNIMKE